MDAATRAGPCGARPRPGSEREMKGQAARGISIGRVNALPRLRRQPIEVVVFDPP